MNAPFHLPAEALRADYDRAHADGELGAGLSMLDHATSALSMGAWHVERALSTGSGSDLDLMKLEHLTSKLAELHLRVETATSRLTAKVRT